MIRVAIAGASGYTGFELMRLLIHHPEVELRVITSRASAGEKLSSVFPALRGYLDLTFEDTQPNNLTKDTDLVFTALPHKASMDIVPELLKKGVRVIDLSADFRFRDATVYEQWYQPHKSPYLLKEAVYGLPELHREAISKARLVANPGCYPTSVILAVAPLIKANLIYTETIIADSKSGVTGAGRSVSLSTHYCEVNEGLRAYKVAQHRHTPEIEQELGILAGKTVRITFTPHLVPMSRGIFTTVYASLKAGVSALDVRKAFEDFYDSAPFIRLCGESELPSTLHVRGTNFCDLGWRIDLRTGRVIALSAIDNLARGASGQAVCNMNLMYQLPEQTGLDAPPWQP